MNVRQMTLGILTMAVIVTALSWLYKPAAQAGTSQSVGGGGVTVTVTPLNKSGDDAAFHVALDTHSVNLDVYKFEEIVRLRDGKGREIPPTLVKDAQGGGHHRSATVQFTWPEPKPKKLELVVKGVAGVPERLFQWTIE